LITAVLLHPLVRINGDWRDGFLDWITLLHTLAHDSVTPRRSDRSLRVMSLRPETLSPLWQVVTAAVVLLAYVALEWISFIHEYKGMPITPWNPGLGVVFALMVLGGARYAAVLFIGVVIAEIMVLHTQLQWSIIFGIAAIVASVYCVVATLLRTHLRLDVGLDHLRDVILLLAAVAVGAVIAALLLSLLLLLDAQLQTGDVAVASGPLLLGDVIGMAVMTPLMLRLSVASRPLATSPSVRHIAVEFLGYAALAAGSLWIIVEAESRDGFMFFYLLFVPVVVAALRHGLDGACVSLAFTQLALVSVLHLYGFDARTFIEFQLLMLVLTATGLIVGVVVSERRTADRLVQAAQARLKEKEAEATEAARYNLVSGMASALAHEINQPMTAARALARSAQHILEHPKPDLPRAAGNLATLVAHIDHAGGVVSHMREFLRRGRPRMSTVDIGPTVCDALSLVRAKAAAHAVTIDIEVPGNLPPVHADRVQLEQVVLNFVHNAIEAISGARQTDGRIIVAATRMDAPARIEISVADNGPGIADDLAEHLFTPLTTSKPEGFGLGLAICAAIVESHGGRVSLGSRQKGATVFRFWLPLNESNMD
jgi:two-component system, LuxR family, sensor kinase FixL